MSDPTVNHYNRLGGAEAIRAAVDELYLRILQDDDLAPYFAGVDVPRIKRHQTQLLCSLLGGPQSYNGRDLADAHRGLGITLHDYYRVVTHLGSALLAAGAQPDTIAAVAEALAGVRPDIVEVGGDE